MIHLIRDNFLHAARWIESKMRFTRSPDTIPSAAAEIPSAVPEVVPPHESAAHKQAKKEVTSGFEILNALEDNCAIETSNSDICTCKRAKAVLRENLGVPVEIWAEETQPTLAEVSFVLREASRKVNVRIK